MSGLLPNAEDFRLIAAAIPPFDRQGRLDLAPIPDLAAYFGSAGLHGVFVNGTTGQESLLSIAERRQIAEAWREALPGDLRLFVHIGTDAPAVAAELAAHAAELGADAIAMRPPAYSPPRSLAALVNCCEQTSAAAPDTPFYYYHIPSMTGVHLPMRAFLEAARSRLPSLRGIKYTDNALNEYLQCQRLGGGRFEILFGRDEMLLAGIAVGATGAVGSTYNFAAPLFRKLLAALGAGDLEAARGYQELAALLVDRMQQYGGIGAVQTLTSIATGIDCGCPRVPQAGPDEADAAALRKQLETDGVLAVLHTA